MDNLAVSWRDVTFTWYETVVHKHTQITVLPVKQFISSSLTECHNVPHWVDTRVHMAMKSTSNYVGQRGKCPGDNKPVGKYSIVRLSKNNTQS